MKGNEQCVACQEYKTQLWNSESWDMAKIFHVRNLTGAGGGESVRLKFKVILDSGKYDTFNRANTTEVWLQTSQDKSYDLK